MSVSVGKSRVITRFARLSSILARTLLVTSGIVFIPSQIFFAATPAYAASAKPSCAAGVGKGGLGTGSYLTTDAGNGCAIIKYISGGSTFYANFDYTGADQSWTVPAGVTNATFYLLGAGGGGGRAFGGGGGGYATGSYSVTPGNVLTIVVGQGGGGVAASAVTGLPGTYSGGFQDETVDGSEV